MGVLSFSKVSWRWWEGLGSLPAPTSDPAGPEVAESKGLCYMNQGNNLEGSPDLLARASTRQELPKDRAGPN